MPKPDPKIRLDLNNPVFQEHLLTLQKPPSASKDDVAPGHRPGVIALEAAAVAAGYGIKRVMSGQPAQCVGFT